MRPGRVVLYAGGSAFTLVGRLRNLVGSRKSTLRALAALTSAQVLTAALGGISSLVQARFIEPDVMGYFSAFGIVTQYLAFLSIGWLSALQRDYPYWIGKGDRQQANKVAAVAEAWVLLVCCSVGAFYSFLAIGSLWYGNLHAALAWVTQAVVAIVFFYGLYLGCTYRSADEFVTWSKFGAVSSVASFLLLPTVMLFAFWGLCIRAAVPAVLTGLLLHQSRPVRVAPQWDFREFWRLLRFGLAMDLTAVLATAGLTGTMATIIAAHYGLAVFGLFTFAKLGETVIVQAANSVALVFVPRINHQMGQTDSLSHCVRYCFKPMVAGTCAALCLILTASVLCRPLVGILTPKYVEAVPMIQVLLWAALLPPLSLPAFAMVAAKHTWTMVIGNLLCFAVFLGGAGIVVSLRLPPVYMVIAYLTALFASLIAKSAALAVLLWFPRSLDGPNDEVIWNAWSRSGVCPAELVDSEWQPSTA